MSNEIEVETLHDVKIGDEFIIKVKKMRRRHFVKITDYTKLDDEKIEAIFKILKPNCP